MTRLTELRVKVCSMYGAVRVFGSFSALLHTPGVCKRVHPLEFRGACVSRCLQCRETELNWGTGGRRECAGELKILTATGSSKAPSLPLLPAPRFPSLLTAHSHSLSLSAVNFFSFPLFTSLLVSLCLHAFSFCYPHRIDLLPTGMQTRAANVSTPKRKGNFTFTEQKRCPIFPSKHLENA